MAVSGRGIGPFLAAVGAVLAVACPPPADAGTGQWTEIPVVRLEGDYRPQPQPRTHPGALPITRLADRDRAGDLDSAQDVSLTIAAPMPVRDVLLMLLRGTPLSITFEPGAAGTFSGELSGLTLRQALEAVLVPSGLDYELKGGVVRVFPRRPATRIFEVDYLDVRRAWTRQLRSLPAGNTATPAADLTSGGESDFFRELEAGIRALLSESGRVHVDRNAGLVQVTDFVDRAEQVGLYVEAVQLRATRQVRLAARVLEVTLRRGEAIDWTAVAARAGSGVRSGGGAGVTVDDFDALLRAIETFGPVRVVAVPQVLAMNNEPAVMRIGPRQASFVPAAMHGRTEPRLAAAAPDGADAAGGLTLTLTPQISADGVVHLSVSPTLTGLRGDVEGDFTLRVRGGDTVVIASPLPGGGTAATGAERKELVMLITPTVVGAGSGPVAGAQ